MTTPLVTTPAGRRRVLARSTGERPTYPEHGATSGVMPPDATQLHHEVAIGRGEAVFTRAAEALLGWRMHRGAGLDVRATTSRAEVGTTVLVTFVRGLPLGLSAPCRVLEVVDEPDRRGFTYGTLPGHPVSGEERFELLRDPEGVVRLSMVTFSRATTPPASWLGSATPVGQRIVMRCYAAAVRRAAAGR